jgi:hypothetical protein
MLPLLLLLLVKATAGCARGGYPDVRPLQRTRLLLLMLVLVLVLVLEKRW